MTAGNYLDVSQIHRLPAMTPLPTTERLGAVLDLMIPSAREEAGHHKYDGVLQDLSNSAVKSGLDRLGGATLDDSHDEAHLAAFEAGLVVLFRDLEAHRTNPLLHLSNLDVSCYLKEYAPEAERHEAMRKHIAGWPDAIDVAISTLDQVAAPVATALLDAIKGLGASLPPDWPESGPAKAAHARLVAHIETCAKTGRPDAAIGEKALAKFMGTIDASTVDLGLLEAKADAEGLRLQQMLDEACQALRPGASTATTVAELIHDSPAADELVPIAQARTAEVIEFTRNQDLVPYIDGECRVGIAPEARRWGIAMLSWSAPGEPDSPSLYDITPPDESWSPEEQSEWLSMFNPTSMLVITAHEVAPGHFAHGRALRRAPGAVRQSLFGYAFAEGWAHYTEELMLEVGFRSEDKRFQVGVALEALVRLTRLACAIGIHRGSMTVDEATARFEEKAYAAPPIARSEARRGTFDPGYGMYTWGKWQILQAREEAKAAWGNEYTLRRFHNALLDLGSPPLGLIGTAIERG